jgi:mannose-6-phosphate isomerase
MAIELARARTMPRPWGVFDLRPWIRTGDEGISIGEIWYERSCRTSSNPSLLLKLLFTSRPLSIQVHPDDPHAWSMGLPNGKTEAWYVLSAAPGAKITLGLKQQITSQQLRQAIDDSSISEIVAQQVVSTDDVIFIPAGTIHAAGAGLVIAEIQQRSDATFRLFDYGSQRELHIERAIEVAIIGPADFQVRTSQLTSERTLLVSNPHFVFERIELEPCSAWSLEAERETWLLVVRGDVIAGSFGLAPGDAVFAQSDKVNIHTGANGAVGLVAYTGAGGPVPILLQRLRHTGSTDAKLPRKAQMPAPPTQMKAALANGPVGKKH